MELKTPLYSCHEKAGGKIVPFAGYLLPVQYGTGVIAEHMAVRTKAGLFDVSHMGEFMFEGKDALMNLNSLLTNDYTVMEAGRVRYSPMCYENGGVVDDLLIYKYSDTKYLAVVNASNRHKDYEWMHSHLSGDCVMTDISDETAEIALQGPSSDDILRLITAEADIPAKYYSFNPNASVGGKSCILSQTGYTGEKGYELYLKNEDAPYIWELLLEKGKNFGLIPCGLGSRDTLRLEAAMPLYGHEMDETISPLETGLGFAVKLGKDEFIGKQAMENSHSTRRRIGLEVTGRGIVREHEDVYLNGEKIGVTTSGTHCPFIAKPCAMALIDSAKADIGTELEVDVRGRRVAVRIIPLPFYKRNK